MTKETPIRQSNQERLLRQWFNALEAMPDYAVIAERVGRPNPPTLSADALEHLNHFRSSIHAGVLPCVETLAFVATAFAKYLERADDRGAGFTGDLHLDEAFGLPSKKRIGTPAKHAAVIRQKEAWFSEMYLYLQTHTDNAGHCTTGQREAAADANARLDIISPGSDEYETKIESMIREFRTWRDEMASK